jgi:hypothetical protein
MTEDEITALVRDRCEGVVVVVAGEEMGAPEAAWGDSFFFYDPAGDIPDNRRFPFATIVVHDYEGFDEASNLNRDGVFRLNVWVGRAVVDEVVEDPAADPATLDVVLPHPVYAAQGWVSILNPGDSHAEQVWSLLRTAHEHAVERHARRAGAD